jgi:shikimate dehydrogenase
MNAAERYAVVGHPVKHSRSPYIHTLFAHQTKQHLIYKALDIAPEQLVEAVRTFFERGGRGLNVTTPHKQAAFALADQLTERATQAKAVNTLAPLADGSLLGHNTDGTGLVRDLSINLKLSLGGKRVLLLGAGGAARGVLAPLLALLPKDLVVANRTAERATQLAEEFSRYGPVRGVGLEQLPAGPFDCIINATTLSLNDALPPLPDSSLGPGSICYDLAYGGADTSFVRWARAHGATHAYTGLGMLVEQAAESFLLWRGVRPQTAPVLQALQHALGVRQA